MSWDPYLDEEHGVLRNRLGITSNEELAAAEADITHFRIAQLHRHPLPGRYDLAHLQAIHNWIFGDIYDWAGEIRTVSIGKGHCSAFPSTSCLSPTICSNDSMETTTCADWATTSSSPSSLSCSPTSTRCIPSGKETAAR